MNSRPHPIYTVIAAPVVLALGLMLVGCSKPAPSITGANPPNEKRGLKRDSAKGNAEQTLAAEERRKQYVIQVKGLSVECRVGSAVVIDSITNLGGLGPQAVSLAAKDGGRLLGVPIEWSVPDDTPVDEKLTVGNLLFRAVRGDEQAYGSAFALDDCSRKVLWFVPSPGEGKVITLDHLWTVSNKTISVAFIVPPHWSSFDIQYGEPDGSTQLIGHVKTNEPERQHNNL